MRILAASDYRLIHNCMTCQHRNICLNTLFFHSRSNSETVFPTPSALYRYKAVDSAGQAERNSKQIESIQRKITHTSTQLGSPAISAFGLQRRLNGVKLTEHSQVEIPVALYPFQRSLTQLWTFPTWAKSTARRWAAAARPEGRPSLRTRGDENPSWAVLHSLETD